MEWTNNWIFRIKDSWLSSLSQMYLDWCARLLCFMVSNNECAQAKYSCATDTDIATNRSKTRKRPGEWVLATRVWFWRMFISCLLLWFAVNQRYINTKIEFDRSGTFSASSARIRCHVLSEDDLSHTLSESTNFGRVKDGGVQKEHHRYRITTKHSQPGLRMSEVVRVNSWEGFIL